MEQPHEKSDSDDENGSPFASNIVNARTPRHFRMQNMDPYDGTTDPRVHLARYAQHMGVAQASEEVMCQCFPIFLTGLAIMWFCRLDRGSIRSWAELIR